MVMCNLQLVMAVPLMALNSHLTDINVALSQESMQGWSKQLNVTQQNSDQTYSTCMVMAVPLMMCVVTVVSFMMITCMSSVCTFVLLELMTIKSIL